MIDLRSLHGKRYQRYLKKLILMSDYYSRMNEITDHLHYFIGKIRGKNLGDRRSPRKGGGRKLHEAAGPG